MIDLWRMSWVWRRDWCLLPLFPGVIFADNRNDHQRQRFYWCHSLSCLFLIEQKERDLELAARIGQSLLQENKSLKSRNEHLESEINASNEKVRFLVSSSCTTKLKFCYICFMTWWCYCLLSEILQQENKCSGFLFEHFIIAFLVFMRSYIHHHLLLCQQNCYSCCQDVIAAF